MIISLDEFRDKLEKYMKIARIQDVYIADEEKQVIWLLTSVKRNWWAENVLPLISAIQQWAGRTAYLRG